MESASAQKAAFWFPAACRRGRFCPYLMVMLRLFWHALGRLRTAVDKITEEEDTLVCIRTEASESQESQAAGDSVVAHVIASLDALTSAVAALGCVAGSTFLQSHVGSAILNKTMSSDRVSDGDRSTWLSSLSGGEHQGDTLRVNALARIVATLESVGGSSFLQSHVGSAILKETIRLNRVSDRERSMSLLSALSGGECAPQSGQITGSLKPMKDGMSADLADDDFQNLSNGLRRASAINRPPRKTTSRPLLKTFSH